LTYREQVASQNCSVVIFAAALFFAIERERTEQHSIGFVFSLE
jgi:hypothetical protein